MSTLARAWRPAAEIEALRFRAALVARIRAFFSERGVLEVTTPVLSQAGATDPQIDSLSLNDAQGRAWWLQSSPEFHMKRLLAAGSGAIYQISPAFRGDEQGRWHNAEFSMLEWYRLGFDHHALMDEIETLWCALAKTHGEPWPRYRYVDLIEQATGLDWAQCSAGQLRAALEPQLGTLPHDLDRNGLLDAAMGLLISPTLGMHTPCFVYDFPPEQAALARVEEGADGQPWARRFEWFWRGQELGNGFHELTDGPEQARRFASDRAQRQHQGQADVPADACLIDALTHGLPDCAGVAVGVDRLCALLMGAENVSSVIAFPTDRA